MSSDNSVNSNHALPGNSKIKIEAGTTLPVPIKCIKTEPGLTATATTTRLTSFRLPRDLTLGGNNKTEKPKRVYTPNLNAQRNKRKEDSTPIKQEHQKSSRGREHGRGRGRGDRGRGRGDRGRGSNLIQSSGVWSEGITSTPGTSRRWGSSGDSGDRNPQSSLEKPKLDLNRTVDKAEEEEKLKALLRDDFIDDGVTIDLDNAPVMLPMIEEIKLYKQELKAEVESDKEEEEDKKPIILENGEVLTPKKEQILKVPKVNILDNLPSTVPQVMESKAMSYILLQLPDCLPGFECTNDDVRSTPSNSNNTSNPLKTEYCTLKSLKPGMLGKLQILRSGKARLVVGENDLIVDVGSHLSFRQDLIAAKLDTTKLQGDLINLGPVTSTFICSPDWESMLAKL